VNDITLEEPETKAPTADDVSNLLKANDYPDLANTILQVEADFDQFKRPSPPSYTKDFEFVHKQLRSEFAPPSSTVGKQLNAFMVKYAPTGNLSNQVNVDRLRTVKTLIKIDAEKDAAKREALYLSLPQFEDPAKKQALDQALSSVKDASKREQVIKDQLNWSDSERKAAELKSRHPDFKELHNALNHFPPLVDVLGEPSQAAKRLAELSLDGRDASEVNVVDFFLNNDGLPSEEKLNAIPDIAAQARKESPSSSIWPIADAYQKHNEAETEFVGNLLGEYRDWTQKRIEWANEMFRNELQASEDMKKMDVDEILAMHPDWAAEIEDDIANYRWDPSIPKAEYERAWAEYLSHYRHA